MIIVEDTRNQTGKHKAKSEYFAKQGIQVVRSKLYVGDYTRLDNQTLCIDTKKDILEIAANVCGKQHERFRAECIRAKECGIKLVVLIEEKPLDGLQGWCSPRNRQGKPLTQVKGETLSKALKTMSEKYGVEFVFCTKQESGAKIVELLGEEI